MKKILFVLLISLLAFSLAACGGTDKNNVMKPKEETTGAQKQIGRSIDSVAKALDLGTGEEIACDDVGASEGWEFKNGAVRIYRFEENTDAYNKAKKNEFGFVNFDAFNDGFGLSFVKDRDQNLLSEFGKLHFKD